MRGSLNSACTQAVTWDLVTAAAYLFCSDFEPHLPFPHRICLCFHLVSVKGTWLLGFCMNIICLERPLSYAHLFKQCARETSTYRPLCFQISARPLFSFSANASPSTWARLVFRWGTPAGSSTAWNMVSSQTARCRATSPWEATMTRSQPSSVRPGRGSTSPERSSLTWNPLSLVWIIILLSFDCVMRWVKQCGVLVKPWQDWFNCQ